MAYALKTTESALIKATSTNIMDFTVAQSVNELWVVNLSPADIEVDIWFDYYSAGSSAVNQFWYRMKVRKGIPLHQTGLWVFANGGRITAQIVTGSDDDAVIHVSKADV